MGEDVTMLRAGQFHVDGVLAGDSWHVWPCFANLLDDPQGSGISGDVEAQNLPPVMADHKKAAQHPKGEGRIVKKSIAVGL
jgi:hypothetical protein